jgi:endonuclease G
MFCAVIFTAASAFATIDSTLQMQLGNPSNATANTNNHDHYLVQRTVEAIDYSDHLGEPVWAAWDLTASDVGSASRTQSYYVDTNLPPNFTPISTTDYNGVGNIGFNRGHLCPSEDRTDNSTNNKLLFFMSNIMPQSGANNQAPWGNFEAYCRSLLTNYELLIICGPGGFGTNLLPSGKVYIPSNSWKVAVCVPLGDGLAASRITASTRTIAITVPNATNGLSSDWHTYVTTPQKIEQATGFTFFTALPADVAGALRTQLDGTPVFADTVRTNGQFRLTINGWSGTNYIVQAATNLTTPVWVNLATNAAPFTYTQANPAAYGQRFYRAKLWP